MREIAEKDADWERYRARQHYLRLMATLEDAKAETEQIRAELERMKAKFGG